MGQTLPNGIYLPAEGERNCYDGLEGNWRSLDSLISTVAGKASATHTHGNISNDGKVGTTANLPLITGTGGAVQAGVFGNQANTFCEGNDSRLSDARTPVAHTHTKSDVTDLLNSNFIPSANNTYDLGSSSYQWNNLYAQNYYYNGVAWGLDKANTWSANNSFYGIAIYGNQTNTFQSNSSVGEKGDASIFALNIQVQDKNHAGWSSSGVANIGMGQDQNGSYMSFALETQDSNNTRRNNALSFLLKPTDNSHNAYFFPNRGGTVDLGTSTNKWKTLNGVNPGALSLPDPSGVLTVEIPSSWVWDGTTENSYTAPITGWIGIGSSMATYVRLFNNNSKIGMTQSSAAGTDMRAYIPMVAGDEIKISGITSSSFVLRVYKCLGNV